PKNGFFSVLDRQTGKLLSADKFVSVTWASHVDLESGRPVENPAARFYLHPNRPVEVAPYANGGHSWHAMSFSPLTRLMYIPATDASMTYSVSAGTGLGATEFEFHFPGSGEPSAPIGKLIAWDP